MWSADSSSEIPQSPAERYAAARQRNRYPYLTEFAATLPFVLDPFQRQACEALEGGAGVLVCAPTGAGKTVVGEFAAARALADGGKCFYTTPIKALSNQKYADLAAVHGSDRVGLLTGDTSVNPHAPIVVMTTEVLRNMLYAGSTDLAGLSAVVLDEIHYLADRFRGAVWEEVIVHLPAEVQVVGLSATVSNAEEFGDWLRDVRGEVSVIVDETRPVPLFQHVLVRGRLYDLFAERAADDEVTDGRSSRRAVAPALRRAVESAGHQSLPRDRTGTDDGRPRSRRDGRRHRAHGGPTRWHPPSRPSVVGRLDRAGLLPAIVFIFSRAGCDAAVEQCVHADVRLTSDDERRTIVEVIDRHTGRLPHTDLQVLGYWEWRAALERGVASHHAGLLPAFKETVEELFVRGLVKVVFATETLALGINMPARTVVLERLVKFNGETHADVTPGEYTQLTGRAGRRGIDVEGHAVVVWSPGLDPAAVAGLAATRTYPLVSSFRPTYNMAVNLVDRLGLAEATSLIAQSFAQFQADHAVVGVARKLAEHRRRLGELATEMTCDRGDVAEYLSLVSSLTDAERSVQRARRARRRETIDADLATLRRGDVIYIPTGRRSGTAVVLDPRTDRTGNLRPLVVTDRRWAGRVDARDFQGAVPVLGRMKLAKRTEYWLPKVRRDLASVLGEMRIRAPGRGTRDEPPENERAEIASLRAAVRSHPVHGCGDREAHLRHGERYAKVQRRAEELSSTVDRMRGSLGAELERIVALLTDRGYLAPGGAAGSATSDGQMLQRIWSESDLLTAECLRDRLWAELPANLLAGAVSTVVFESRRETVGSDRHLAGPLRAACDAVVATWSRLHAAEHDGGLEGTRAPDDGFAAAIATWAEGSTLAEALLAAAAGGQELAAGDFVRWSRQVIDLLDQIAVAAPRELAPNARRAVHAIRRGVVALGAA